MRKFSKTLAVLLTVCLLAGVVVSIVASADEPTLFNSGNALNFVTDYPSNKTAFDATSGGYRIGSKVVYDADNGYAKIVYEKGYDGVTTDAFFHPTDAELASGVWGEDRGDLAGQAVSARGLGHSAAAMAGGAQWLTHDKIKDNGIVAGVFEFDYGTDSNRYSYTNGAGKKVYSLDLVALNALIDADESVTDKAAAKAEAAASEELAMYECTGANAYMRFEGCSVLLYHHKVDGVWYLYTSATAAEDVNDMIKLSNKAGVFDRFSFVWSFTYNEDDSITCVCNLYVNGEFYAKMTEKNITAAPEGTSANNASYAAFRRWYHAGLATTEMHFADTYSLVYDNIAANYYTAAELATYGLRGGLTTDYVEANGIKYYFSAEGAKALTANLKDGGTVKTGISLDTFAPANELKNFFIDLENGATVTLTPEAALVYDAYLVDAANQVYLYVNNGSLRGANEEEFIIFEDSLFYNNFSTTSFSYYKGTDSNSGGTNVKGRYGSFGVSDGDIGSGIIVEANKELGYLRIYSAGMQHYLGSTGGAFWGYGASSLSLKESDYSVLDFDYGTERYTFSYTADVVRTIEATGTKADGSSYPASQAATDMGNLTLYMTVSSKAEYDAYVANPSLLNGTKVTETKAFYSDRYTATQTDVITNAKIVEGSFRPAYIAPYFWMNDGSGKKYQQFFSVAYNSADKQTYISIGDNKIALSGEAKVTDHITMVFDNGITTAGKVTAAVYVNGQFLGQVESTYSHFGSIGVYNLNSEERARDNYSMMLDNIAFNQYATGYTTADAYGVDDLITDLKAGTVKPVSACADVYYTSAKAFPGAWATVDGGKTVATIAGEVNALIAGLENGDTLWIGDDIAFSSLPADRSFTVKAFNAAAVVLAGNAEETHKLYMIGDLYYVVGTGAGAMTRAELNKTSDRYNIYTDFTVSGSPALNATDASKDVNSGSVMQSDETTL
ncbi:MAG: hypothetical protein E7612_05295 [Ruminococcaceae bacterium]|nr:hypothetical protein [Oscillospiraceae bacterium]